MEVQNCSFCLLTAVVFQVGELVYAIVTRAHPHIEPEISCVDGSGKSDGLGALDISGFLIRCSLGLCRK